LYRLSKTMLAERMDMPVSTFKNKLNPKYPQITFTEAEHNKLISILFKMQADINHVLLNVQTKE
ncbi:MAG TPA: hypothetical protein VEA58_11425, partial [Anaerovoracaceae bacterium]|nr:hypothetical protein [Anaerovoracaceae bacterium]